MSWNQAYIASGAIWGDTPSEVARIALEHLRRNGHDAPVEVLDIGCGYGRDALYLARHLPGRVTGIDLSEQALEMARASLAESGLTNATFHARDLRELSLGEGYDVVLVSNLYHLCRPEMRNELRSAIRRVLRPGGWLFLNALSTADPEEYGQGEPVIGDPNAFEADKYRHFSSEDELRRTFGYVELPALYEHAYDEPHPGARTHQHIAWILVGRRGTHGRP